MEKRVSVKIKYLDMFYWILSLSTAAGTYNSVIRMSCLYALKNRRIEFVSLTKTHFFRIFELGRELSQESVSCVHRTQSYMEAGNGKSRAAKHPEGVCEPKTLWYS